MKFLAIFLITFIFIGCEKSNSDNTLRIGQQHGMQYSGIYLANELDILAKYLPNTKVELRTFSGGSAIAEALISGHLDVGCFGIAPALIAMDKGAKFKIAFGLSVPPSQLIVMDKSIKSLNDIKDSDKIAIPSVGSIQHITLSIAAQKLYNNPHKFDKNIIAMANPEAFNALINKTDIVAHFASMPYIGIKTSIVCAVNSEFYTAKNTDYQGLLRAVDKSIALLNAKDLKAIDIVTKVEKISQKEALEYIEYPNSIFSTKVYGLSEIYEYMLSSGHIKNPIKELIWDKEMMAK
jgi:NitT/TauT family transport system substrate-binding protein